MTQPSPRGIATLKKVAKARLDEEARRLADLRAALADLAAAKEAIRQRMRAEAACVDDESRIGYYEFLRTSMALGARADREMAALAGRIAAQEAAVRAAFAEGKRYEIVEDGLRRRAADEAARAERAEADDLAQSRWGRTA